MRYLSVPKFCQFTASIILHLSRGYKFAKSLFISYLDFLVFSASVVKAVIGRVKQSTEIVVQKGTSNLWEQIAYTFLESRIELVRSVQNLSYLTVRILHFLLPVINDGRYQ
jgi:hypothetical protein